MIMSKYYNLLISLSILTLSNFYSPLSSILYQVLPPETKSPPLSLTRSSPETPLFPPKESTSSMSSWSSIPGPLPQRTPNSEKKTRVRADSRPEPSLPLLRFLLL